MQLKNRPPWFHSQLRRHWNHGGRFLKHVLIFEKKGGVLTQIRLMGNMYRLSRTVCTNNSGYSQLLQYLYSLERYRSIVTKFNFVTLMYLGMYMYPIAGCRGSTARYATVALINFSTRNLHTKVHPKKNRNQIFFESNRNKKNFLSITVEFY